MNLLKSVKLRVEIFGCYNLGIRYDGIFQANLRWKDCWCSDLEPTPGAQVSPSRYAVCCCYYHSVPCKEGKEGKTSNF